MALTRPTLARAARRTATVAGVLAWVQSLLAFTTRTGSRGAAVEVFLLAAMGLILMVAARQAVAAKRDSGLAGYVFFSGVTILWLPYVSPSSLNAGGAPPLMHVSVVGLLVTCAIADHRASISAAALLGLGTFAINLDGDGWARALLESTLFLAVALLCPLILSLLERAATQVDEAHAAGLKADEARLRAYRRAKESERWDALVHDKVLGALGLCLLGRWAPAQSLAADALSAMAGSATPPDFASAVQEHTAGLGLMLDLHVVGREEAVLDRDVPAAVTEVACDLLSNVSRHSGAHRASVRACFAERHVSVEVVDEGRGFDPDALVPRRAGLKRAQVRMRRLGGAVTIQAASGAGTRVSLAWVAPSAEPRTRATWRPDVFRQLMALGVLITAIDVALGLEHLADTQEPAVALAGAVASLGLLLAVGKAGQGSRWAVAVVPLLALVTHTQAANVVVSDHIDWRYWFVGAQNAAVGLLALRHSGRLGFAAGLAVVLGVMTGSASAGGVDFYRLITLTPQLLLCAVGGALLRRGLATAVEASRKSMEVVGLSKLRVAEEDERHEMARGRVATLREQAGAMLTRIALNADSLSEQELASVARLEAVLRDQLVAGAVLTPTLSGEVQACRERGVVVEIASDATAPSPRQLVAFDAVLRAVLAHVGCGDRVVALWSPRPDGRQATVAVTGRSVLAEWHPPRLDEHDVRFSLDPDCALVVLCERPVSDL